MNRLHFSVIIICLILSFEGLSQTFAPNQCDSSLLTKQEYEKCKRDTIFNNDIFIRVNYIIFLKTELLPKYRLQRKALILPDDIRRDVKLLKTIYDSTVAFKLQRMTLDMDRNQNHIQPKAYVTSLLALETFKFYPDVYAILINEIHLRLDPKTTDDQMKEIQAIMNKIYSSLSNATKDKLYKICSSLKKERKEYTKRYSLNKFQGIMDEEQQKEYEVINFLLWTE